MWLPQNFDTNGGHEQQSCGYVNGIGVIQCL